MTKRKRPQAPATLRIDTQYRCIYRGNNQIGYYDLSGDVFIYKHGNAEKIGNVDHSSEVIAMVESHASN